MANFNGKLSTPTRLFSFRSTSLPTISVVRRSKEWSGPNLLMFIWSFSSLPESISSVGKKSVFIVLSDIVYWFLFNSVSTPQSSIECIGLPEEAAPESCVSLHKSELVL